VRRAVVILLLVLSVAAGGAGTAFADGPADEQPTRREREVLRERPSGFWTSNKPAEHGAYRWRLLGIGVGLIGITGFVIFRLIKKTDAERVRRQSGHAETPQ
jgi:hypothetical protein